MSRAVLASVALLSAAALGYEVLLLRLFAILQWHHFAAMVISLALFGYGLSGSFLALAHRRLEEEGRFPLLFSASALLFSVAAPGAVVVVQAVAFNPLELPWDWGQAGRLAVTYVVLSVPFLFAANGIGLALQRFQTQAGRVYGADLAGAGLGAVGVLGLLAVMPPLEALLAAGALGVLAALLGSAGVQSVRLAAMPAAGVLIWFALAPGIVLTPSPYKPLSQALNVVGVQVVAERSDARSLVTVIESPRVPFRHAPGLSLLAPAGPPEQRALFLDGAGPVPVDRRLSGEQEPAYLGWLTSALVYELVSDPDVLVLGGGGGRPVSQALGEGARKVYAVEADAKLVSLLRGPLSAFSSGLYDDPRITVRIGGARAFLAATRWEWDVVYLPSMAGGGAGLEALRTDHLYTVEGMGAALDRLRPGGWLTATTGVDLPPRAALKLAATAAEALRRHGVADPGANMAMIRGWSTVTLVLGPRPLTPDEREAVRLFASERGFDLVHLPGMTAAEANRHTLLSEPSFHLGVARVLAADGGMVGYAYDIRPATDDRPYFRDFFRWRLLPSLMAEKGRGGPGLVEWGFPVLAAALAQALVIAVPLILAPLLLARRSVRGEGRWRVLVYFLALGLGFLSVEIAFLQRVVPFLGHPVYAASAVLGGFLVFAGIGAKLSGRWALGSRARLPSLAVAALALAYAAGLGPLFEAAGGLPEAARWCVALLAVAPLAIPMGMPFPTGLARLAARGEEGAALVPWAWAINGCASVVAALLAALLAASFGFGAVVVMAAVLYVVAAATVP